MPAAPSVQAPETEEVNGPGHAGSESAQQRPALEEPILDGNGTPTVSPPRVIYITYEAEPIGQEVCGTP